MVIATLMTNYGEKMIKKVQFRRTTLIGMFSVAVVLGVASANFGFFVGSSYVIGLFLVSLAVIKKRGFLALLCVLILGLAIGSWRGANFLRLLNPVNDLYSKQVILTGIAQTDGVYSSNSQLSFDVGQISISDPIQAQVPGKIKAEGFGINAVYRGDKVQVEGKLQDSMGSRVGRVSFATIKVIDHNSSPIESARHGFNAGMFSALPEPQASFGLGLLIGEKTTLPKRVTDNLSTVGLTHIIAVSGYNLTIIVVAVRRLMSKRSKYQAAMTAVLLIGLFVLMTGFSASIVRAGIVSMLSIAAWYYGRSVRPILLIFFTAALTALWNPLYVWTDAGWYLSFLAFFGVLVLAPLIANRTKWRRAHSVIGLLMIESLSAQLMTAPYILFTFKQISLLALPANILVVPLVPIAMFLSLIAGIAGMIITPIAGWFAWPAKIVLTYILDLAALFARVPNAVLKRTLSVGGLVMIYGCMILIILALARAVANRGTITDSDTGNS